MDRTQERPRRTQGLVVAAGSLAIVAGQVGLGAIGYWYAADMGWTGSGSTIHVSRSPIVAAACVPAVAVLVGVVTLLLRRDISAASPAGMVLLGADVLLALAVIVAVEVYPQVENARLTGHAHGGWQTELPVTHVFGLRSQTGEAMTIVGRADRRGCDWVMRAVTLDRSTGDILAVEALPTTFADPSGIPPAPTPLDPGFELLQGEAPFICRS